MPVWLWLWMGWALAQGFDPRAEVESEAMEPRQAEQAAQEARLEALARERSRRGARVLVLRWPEAPIDHRDLALRLLVQQRIGRPSARFYPEIDLHQQGRTRPGHPPEAQQARVSEERLAELMAQAQALRRRPVSRQADREEVLLELMALEEEIWVNDRPATRLALFRLQVQMAELAGGLDDHVPPHFRLVGGTRVSYAAYRAAAMLWEGRQVGDDSLEPWVPGGQAGRFIHLPLTQLERGVIPWLPVGLHEGGRFEPERFHRDVAEVRVNGLVREVDEDGLIRVPRGRIDVQILRDDGHGLADRVEVARLEDKVYFVQDAARQRLGYELLTLLMVHPQTCRPPLPEGVRATLATYQALHPDQEIFLALPEAGSLKRLRVWRWDSARHTLELLRDPHRGFPVRFAVLAGTGLGFHGLNLSADEARRLSDRGPEDLVGAAPPVEELEALSQPGTWVTPTPGYVPIDLQLRVHWHRLVVGMGVQIAKNVAGGDEGRWTDLYATDGNPVVRAEDGADDRLQSDGGAGDLVLREVAWQRVLQGTVGVVLLEDAPFGLGPWVHARVGYANVPHAVQTTVHVGVTQEPSFGKDAPTGRVMPLLDAEVWAGARVAVPQTLYVRTLPQGRSVGRVAPDLGFALRAGFSF